MINGYWQAVRPGRSISELRDSISDLTKGFVKGKSLTTNLGNHYANRVHLADSLL